MKFRCVPQDVTSPAGKLLAGDKRFGVSTFQASKQIALLQQLTALSRRITLSRIG